MIGIDTNIIIRYITQDDETQSQKANDLIDNQLSIKQQGFITLLSMVEISWVLESCYKQDRHEVLSILNDLLAIRQLVVEQSDIAYLAIKRCNENTKTDFSDALITIINEHQGCDITYTFDKKAQKVGMTLL